MTEYVLDVSAVLTWCFDDETEMLGLPDSADTAETRMHVPALWPLELLNALLVAGRRGRLPIEDALEFLELVFTLPLAIEESPKSARFVGLLALAREQQLTVYDAAYLDLALRLGVPLATRDTALADAARRRNVALLAEAPR